MSARFTDVGQVGETQPVARSEVRAVTLSQASTCLRKLCEAVLLRMARRLMQ